MKVDALEVGAGDIAGVEAGLAEADGLAVVVEVLLGDSEGLLGDEQIGKRLANVEDELTLLVTKLALGDIGGRGGDVETPATLLAALEEPGDVGGVVVGVAVGVDLGEGDALSVEGQGGVLAETSGDLRCLHGGQMLGCAASMVGLFASARSTACCSVMGVAGRVGVAWARALCPSRKSAATSALGIRMDVPS